MTLNTAQDALPYALGATAVTNPIWLEWLQPGYQYLIAGLGLVVIVLTIRNKWLEIQIKKNILEDHDKQ
jgi:hypothetical protein